MGRSTKQSQKVTMQMLTKKQWKSTMIAARFTWGVGEVEHDFHQKHFGRNLQANYDYFLKGYNTKKELIDFLILLGVYSYEL